MNQKIPELVKNEMRKFDKDSKVILFGSRVRNESHSESDWDFLILSKFADSKLWKSNLRDKLYELELASDSVIGSIIHTHEDWRKLSVTPLHQIISKEGVAV